MPGSHEDRTLTQAARPKARARPPEPAPVRIAHRYVDQALIGRGGMGEVRRVLDERLDRPVAMKILHPGYEASEEARALFLAEARLTAGLQHPGVVSVHDLGELPDGRLWFTMAEIQGRTLAMAIAAGDLPLRRLIDLLARVAVVLAYAHARRVVHLDVKPSNIMLGPFGEVYLVDWGISALIRRQGQVVGSPAYMAPEQARAAATTPTTDVYALGLILRELLTGTPAAEGTVSELVARAAAGPPPPLPALPLDQAELGELVHQMLAEDPAHRPAAREVVARLEAWLDGARNLERARQLVHDAEALAPVLQGKRNEIEGLRARAAALLAGLPPGAGDAQKEPAWQMEDAAGALERELAEGEVAYLRSLQGALSLQAQLPEASALMAAYFRELAERGERNGDPLAAAQASALVRVHDVAGIHADWLAGAGVLDLDTAPSGLPVRVRSLQAYRRRLLPHAVVHAGQTPIADLKLARGTYLVEVGPAEAPVRYPVEIRRGRAWDRVPPGADGAQEVAVPADRSLSAEEVFVAGGWFWSGGDHLAADALERRRLWVDGFVITRQPVTEAAYCDFLNDLEESEATAREPTAGPSREQGLGMLDLVDGVYRPKPGNERLPVCLVSWHDACAYAAWWAARTGQPWRLPHDQEWEKAARGVDGRPWPWGHHLEVDRACMLGSTTPPSRAAVDAFPIDESPYGVRGVAGGVRDWCLNGYDRAGPPDGSRVDPHADCPGPRLTRGGAWGAMPALCRLAGRFAAPPDARLLGVGFRLARSWP